ncbi:MAG: hypothetical protein NDI88_15795 [Lysobacter sp.]|nr:hypothetical protein [Lysobacter sp.]
MARNAKMRRRPVAATGQRGRDPASKNGNPHQGLNLPLRYIVRGGKAFFGVLPGFRHIRAANDPEA